MVVLLEASIAARRRRAERIFAVADRRDQPGCEWSAFFSGNLGGRLIGFGHSKDAAVGDLILSATAAGAIDHEAAHALPVDEVAL